VGSCRLGPDGVLRYQRPRCRLPRSRAQPASVRLAHPGSGRGWSPLDCTHHASRHRNLITKYASDLGERVSAKFETYLDKPAKQDQWQKDKLEEVGITLISGDFDKLACAHDKSFDGVHCQFADGE